MKSSAPGGIVDFVKIDGEYSIRTLAQKYSVIKVFSDTYSSYLKSSFITPIIMTQVRIFLYSASDQSSSCIEDSFYLLSSGTVSAECDISFSKKHHIMLHISFNCHTSLSLNNCEWFIDCFRTLCECCISVEEIDIFPWYFFNSHTFSEVFCIHLHC